MPKFQSVFHVEITLQHHDHISTHDAQQRFLELLPQIYGKGVALYHAQIVKGLVNKDDVPVGEQLPRKRK